MYHISLKFQDKNNFKSLKINLQMMRAAGKKNEARIDPRLKYRIHQNTPLLCIILRALKQKKNN